MYASLVCGVSEVLKCMDDDMAKLAFWNLCNEDILPVVVVFVLKLFLFGLMGMAILVQ
jgi:hypothetical protein